MARLAVALAALLTLAACSGQTASRREVVDAYRRALVRQGVKDVQARCLTDKFFAGLSDAQLREFQQRDQLTDAEKQRFAELAAECPDTNDG